MHNPRPQLWIIAGTSLGVGGRDLNVLGGHRLLRAPVVSWGFLIRCPSGGTEEGGGVFSLWPSRWQYSPISWWWGEVCNERTAMNSAGRYWLQEHWSRLLSHLILTTTARKGSWFLIYCWGHWGTEENCRHAASELQSRDLPQDAHSRAWASNQHSTQCCGFRLTAGPKWETQPIPHQASRELGGPFTYWYFINLHD